MEPFSNSWLLLLGAIVAAHTLETALGFGATILALSLGVHFVPLRDLVVALVLLALVQSLWMAVRGWKWVAWRVLFLRILPIAAVGFPIGILCSRILEEATLRVILGGLVFLLALVGLLRNRPLPRALAPAALAGGGFFHGLLGTGGPLLVLYAGQKLPEKAPFRATLAILWLLLNSVLLTTFWVQGRLALSTALRAGSLLPALVGGIAVGELLYARAPQKLFRIAVYLVLVAIGILLLW